MMAQLKDILIIVVAIVVVIHQSEAKCLEYCNALLKDNPSVPSGYYLFTTSLGKTFPFYCEMGLGGGGFTFPPPQALPYMAQADIDAIFTNKSSVLMRLRQTDGTQPYAIMSTIPEISEEIFVGLSTYGNNTPPANIQTFENPYLYFGFMNASAQEDDVQGFVVNGNFVSITNCSGTPTGQITLWPNFNEAPIDNLVFASNVSIPFVEWMGRYFLDNPSTRVMAPDMFMFAEMMFGNESCGSYTQTDSRLPTTLGVAIGCR